MKTVSTVFKWALNVLVTVAAIGLCYGAFAWDLPAGTRVGLGVTGLAFAAIGAMFIRFDLRAS